MHAVNCAVRLKGLVAKSSIISKFHFEITPVIYMWSELNLVEFDMTSLFLLQRLQSLCDHRSAANC